MKFTIRKGLKQFASTFKEFHYLAAGFAVGLITGWVAGSLWADSLGNQ